MSVAYNQRSCYCGQVGVEHVGQELILTGWVQKRRDHGGMVFIDLRDRTGLVQIKFNPESDPKAHTAAGRLRSEFCIAIRGEVAPRPDDMINPRMQTGKVEVNAREIEILSESETPVFEIEDATETNEETRLKYRYLDLRRPVMQNALTRRHRIAKALRDYFDTNGFVEIETPFLTKSTPEGARDYLVPSRVQQGHFYALPQSPQLFKQLLMMSGFDRYVQIVRCFRDEDLRADRQPEFTQLDMEMSFVQTDDVLQMVEGALAHVMKTVLDVEIPTPFPRMSYDEAMNRFGIDRPDTRYGLEINDVGGPCGKLGFRVFDEPLKAGGTVRCIVVPGGAEMTRKETDTLTDDLKGIGAGGLPLVKVAADGDGLKFETGIAKFFTPEVTAELCQQVDASAGDLILFAADTFENACKYLSWLRETLAKRRNLIPAGKWNFLWVVDFPMFQYSEDDGRWYAMHHPFTAPRDEHVDLLKSGNAAACRAKAYDVVLNGIELGGGSIRIHRADVQEAVFKLLDLSEEEQNLKFKFLLEALRYGPPPHGGIALGLDRMVMLLTGMTSLREVFSFPKTQRAVCPLTEAPGPVADAQLEELYLRLRQ